MKRALADNPKARNDVFRSSFAKVSIKLHQKDHKIPMEPTRTSNYRSSVYPRHTKSLERSERTKTSHRCCATVVHNFWLQKLDIFLAEKLWARAKTF